MRGRRPPRRQRPPVHRTLDLKMLRNCREQRELTLARVKELTGLGTSTLSDYEAGRVEPPLNKIQLLVEVYGLDCFEILELLRFNVLAPGYIRLFREACARASCSSQEALQSLIEKFYLENSSLAHHRGE
jgi:transcriptional regulator with XRE-family HTH domain